MQKLELIGRVFGRLTVIAEAGTDKSGARRLRCRCKCGNFTVVYRNCLMNGSTQSCRCLQKEGSSRRMLRIIRLRKVKRHSLIFGKTFNRLTAIGLVDSNRHGKARVKCACRCGKTVTVLCHRLVNNLTKSCGCLRKEVSRGHIMKIRSVHPPQHRDITGRVFNKWVAVKYLGKSQWRCKCDCGNSSVLSLHALENGIIKGCRRCFGKLMGLRQTLPIPVGKFFGSIEVVGPAVRAKCNRVQWMGRCHLSNTTKPVLSNSLIRRNTRSFVHFSKQAAVGKFLALFRVAHAVQTVNKNQPTISSTIMRKKSKNSSNPVDRFVNALSRGLDGLSEAGEIASEQLKRTKGKWADTVNKAHPEIPQLLIRTLAKVGRKEWIPQLLLALTPGEKALRECSYATQQKYFSEPIKTVLRKGSGWVSKGVRVQNMDDDIACQVFKNGEIRDEDDQKIYIDQLGVDAVQGDHLTGHRAPKDFWSHVSSCSACNRLYKLIVEHIAENKIPTGVQDAKEGKNLLAA